MSDNEDLLGDDLEDHSLADYNLGNDEEDQLLADDYEGGGTQNVPSSVESFREPADMVPSDYSGHGMDYGTQPAPYQPIVETECVVPNIVVEIPNLPPAHSTYAPYEPRHYEPEHSVPPAMPTTPIEPPQIVPSEIVATIPSDMSRERFISERPVGAQRLPQVRDIPDTLDKVVVRGRTWRNPHYAHPYRRHHMHRGNMGQRSSFPPPVQARPPAPMPPMPSLPVPPQMPEMMEHPPLQPPPLPQIRIEVTNRPIDLPRPPFHPERPMDMPRPQMDIPRPPMELPRAPMDMPRPRMDIPRPQMEMPRPHMEMHRPRMDMARPHMDMGRPPFQFQRFSFREERPMFNQIRPQFERPMYYPRQQFQRFGPPLPQVTIRQNIEQKEAEIRMLPLPGAGLSLAGKKVLINPHFKGNMQPPVEGLSMPTYIPTRIQKSPPLSPTLENKFGPIKDIDDAAERFIAEQRNALARAAGRKFARRSPQRYIEDTTIEIENELARPRRRASEEDLLRRQEAFIHANRAGLRRRMRSPSPSPSPPPPLPPPPPGTGPARRSLSPAHTRRDPDHRERRHRPNEEDSEYKRRVREQENMRERVLRAKEVRRRKNAALYIKQMQNREKEEKEKVIQKELPTKLPEKSKEKPEKPAEEETKPDTTRNTPERDWTPELDNKTTKTDEVNSTCEDLTPPAPPAASRVETPPLASDDELDLILGDIDGILSDDDDILTKKDDKPKPKPEPPKPKVTDLRSKLPPKSQQPPEKKPRQKIIFTDDRDDTKKKEKSPPRRAIVSSTKADDSEIAEKKSAKTKQRQEMSSNKSRQRIIFENKDLAKQAEREKADKEKAAFSNRRVIIQRKLPKESKSVFSRIDVNDPSKPNPGIFSRAVRTIERGERGERGQRGERDTRIVVRNSPEVEYDSDGEEGAEPAPAQGAGLVARVDNLPHGMTDTRLHTLAADVQSLILDKEERSARITFKSPSAAETFRKKFNNKMVAASRLTVTLQ